MEEDCYIELPIQNYLGYRAFDEKGDRLEIVHGEGGRIRIAAIGDGKEHSVYVRYGRVPLFMAANIISALTVAAIGWQLWRKRKKTA